MSGAGLGSAAGALLAAGTWLRLVAPASASATDAGGALGWFVVTGAGAGALVGAAVGLGAPQPQRSGRSPVVLRVLWWIAVVVTIALGWSVASLPVGMQFFGDTADRVDYQSSALAALAAAVPLVVAAVLGRVVGSRVASAVGACAVIASLALAVHYLLGADSVRADPAGSRGPDGAAAVIALVHPGALALYAGAVAAVVVAARRRRRVALRPRS